MPRYYFHTEDGRSLSDTEGVELVDLEAAKAEGLKTLGEILARDPGEFWSAERFVLTIGRELDAVDHLYTFEVGGKS
jgi:hypothetical protein